MIKKDALFFVQHLLEEAEADLAYLSKANGAISEDYAASNRAKRAMIQEVLAMPVFKAPVQQVAALPGAVCYASRSIVSGASYLDMRLTLNTAKNTAKLEWKHIDGDVYDSIKLGHVQANMAELSVLADFLHRGILYIERKQNEG